MFNNGLWLLLCLCACIIAIPICLSQESKKTMNKNEKVKSVEQPNRPQTPKPPFPYTQEEVSFENKAAGITLAGTLTFAQSAQPLPAVILISGMGPNDRDGNMMGHKLYFVIADYLTRQGIAVLRYDKRGAGKSTGTFDYNLTSRDFANDVLCAIEYLKTRKEINPHQIGLIGHSEGGLIATMIAAESNDVAFLVLLGAAITNTVAELIEQTNIQLHFDNASPEMIANDSALRKQILETILHTTDPIKTENQLRAQFANYWNGLPQTQKDDSAKLLFAFSQRNIEALIGMMNSPWYRFFFKNNPSAALAQIKVPLLAVTGQLDFIPARMIFPIIEQGMQKAGNKDHTTIELPMLNHSFQTCKTGGIAEYATIEETIAPIALNTIADWILAKTK